MATPVDGRRFLLVYGSQTGQAQAIAEQICEEAKVRGYSPELHCLSNSEKKFSLHEEPVAVIVVSTTGDGEPPDTVNRFWRKLKKRTQPQDLMKDVQYALLGLGDTNYTNFCNMGKMLNKRLLELGGKPFHETGYADDGVGLELVVEPWIEGLWPALNAVFNPSTNCLDSVDQGQDSNNQSVDTTQESLDTAQGSLDTAQESLDTTNQSVQGSAMLPVGVGSVDGLRLEEMNIEADTGPEDIEVSLRGSRDESWISQTVNLPSVQPHYLNVKLNESAAASAGACDFSFTESVQGSTMTSSVVTMATITNRRVLTSRDAQKTVLELELDWSESSEGQLRYEAGDALCVMCPNDPSEVDYIIKRLDLESVSGHVISLSIIPDTVRKNPLLPKHIPTACTVHQYFTHCADLRAIPKKAFLLVLAEFCSDVIERRRLQWFASRQGSQDYSRFIIETHIDLLDILHCFSSCHPPLSRLIELVPRLQARHYSVVSSPLDWELKTRIAFNIVGLPPRSWLNDKRQGLCTGWLNHCSLNDSPSSIPLYPRLRNPFHLPPDPLAPVILIGPGTGVSPLIGFLKHRSAMMRNGFKIGKSWLFFGCRHPDRDHLYRSEIEGFLSTGVLKFYHASFSQYDQPPDGTGHDGDSIDVRHRYVQDNMRKHWEDLSHWIMEENAYVYVCGDAQKMMVSIKEAMIDVLQNYCACETGGVDGGRLFKDLLDQGRYVTDLWI